jgi:hypothetical protein
MDKIGGLKMDGRPQILNIQVFVPADSGFFKSPDQSINPNRFEERNHFQRFLYSLMLFIVSCK